MKPQTLPALRTAGRRGFTLVELMVTIAIIAILAGMVSGALIVARNSAREAATKATITKLHNIIMAKYETYATRRLPIQFSGATSVGQSAALRMFALRDLMRMEMPERLTDIFEVDNAGNPSGLRGPNQALKAIPGWEFSQRPGILKAYETRIGNKWSSSDSRGFAPAECLYMIVTMSCGAEERRQFHASEVADTNGNGLPEFIDGWGRPIFFLRWAPGFNDSDQQPNVVDQADLDATSPGNELAAWTTATVLQRRRDAQAQDHDRLDQRQINVGLPGDNPYVPCGWRLVPLIYSAGPDGEYGIASYPQTGTYVWNEVSIPDPNRIRFYGTDYQSGWGLPVRNQTGAWVHFDNIHNHRIESE